MLPLSREYISRRDLAKEVQHNRGRHVSQVKWRTRCSTDQAEDIVSSVICRILCGTEEIHNQAANSYVNLCFSTAVADYYRDHWKRNQVSFDDEAAPEHYLRDPKPTPEELALRNEEYQQLLNLVDSLMRRRPKLWGALYCTEFLGLSHDNVAEIMDIDVTAVRMRTSRARSHLRKQWRARYAH